MPKMKIYCVWIATVGLFLNLFLTSSDCNRERTVKLKSHHSESRKHKTPHIYFSHKKRKLIPRKWTQNPIVKDEIIRQDVTHRGNVLNGKEDKSTGEIQRLINCKIQTGRFTFESRFVICNGKRHKVSPRVRKILKELGTRRDMFPDQGDSGGSVGSTLYGKPITSFLDDPSLPQASTSSPHSKYPGLGLFDPGLHSTEDGGATNELLNFPSNRHLVAENTPEAPGEDTPQLAPPEKPTADNPPFKSEEPNEDLKKKFGVGGISEERGTFDEAKQESDEDQNLSSEGVTGNPDIVHEQDEENQYKAMQASKLNSGELHDIENLLHDSSDGGQVDSSDNLGATHYGNTMDTSNQEDEGPYAGPGPDESKAAAVREAVREREQETERATAEERKNMADQTIRESEEEKIKMQASNEADKIAKESTSETSNEANSLGLAGMAADDDMPSTAPLGSIWSSLRNSFYATTQSQLGEMDPTSNTIGRGKVHRPGRLGATNVRKPSHEALPKGKTSFHRKMPFIGKSLGKNFDFSLRKIRNSSLLSKNASALQQKIKKSDITKANEALVPLDVVRNLLLQSKDLGNKTSDSKKSSKRNRIIPLFFENAVKRYQVNGVTGPSFVPAVPGFGPNNFVQFGMQPGYPPMGNGRQMFPSPMALTLPRSTYQSYNFQGDTNTNRDETGDDRNAISAPFMPANFPGIYGVDKSKVAPAAIPLSAGGFQLPQMVPMLPPGGRKGAFQGFVSVPIVEAVSPYRRPFAPYQLPYARAVPMPDLSVHSQDQLQGLAPSQDLGSEQASDQTPDQMADQAPEQDPEEGREPGTEQGAEEGPDRGPEQAPEQGLAPGPEQEQEPEQGQERDASPFEMMSSPQNTLPSPMYREPQYDPRETEAFHPEGSQPESHPYVSDDTFRQAERDAAQARELAMENASQDGMSRGAYEGEGEQDGPGYKRTGKQNKKKKKKQHRSDIGLATSDSTLEKKDGKIVFTKEHIGFGPITVEAKTATAPLHDDDDDNDGD